jgi:hypothetical protein
VIQPEEPMLGSTRRFPLMRNLLLAVGLLLALLCAWLVFAQPSPDSLNADGAARVQEETTAELAPEISADELTAVGANESGTSAISESGDARREAIGELPDGMAEIEVKVTLANSSQAMWSIEVRAQRVGGIESTFGDAVKPIESVRTGKGGEAVLRVPAGVALVVSAGGPGKVSVRVSQDGEMAKLKYDLASQEIEALLPGEKINIALSLFAATDLHWFQLVDGATGALLAGARVLEPDSAKQEADEDAMVSVPESNDFFGRQVVIFGLEGYGPRRVFLNEGGDVAERALRVELFPSASLRLTVLQNGLPLGGARLAMHYAKSDGEIELPNRARWGGKPLMAPFWGDTNEQGVLLFEGLPSHHPLVYGIARSVGADIAQSAPGPVTLQPSEQREITWEIGNQQDLHGRAIDTDGSPVAGVEVWLLNSRFQHGVGIDQASVTEWVEHYRIAGVSTNDDGEFSFVEIHPGEYWVALAPTDDANLLATARRVNVPPLRAPPFVELQFSSGANVRGKCVTLTGEAIAGIDVFAMEMEGRATFQGHSKEDGSFEVGPFSAGSRVQFFVLNSSQGYQITESISAIAGDGQEVLLRMTKGGTIRGRTVNDEDGLPISIGVTISSLEAGGSSGTTSGPQGVFDWSGLAPGTWRVIAKSKSGWVGVSQPIVLTAADLVEDIEVRVSPGGTLMVESEGEASGTLRLSFEGWTVDFATIGPGERKSVTVPLGVIQISLLNGDPKPPRIGVVTVGAGKAATFILKQDA